MQALRQGVRLVSPRDQALNSLVAEAARETARHSWLSGDSDSTWCACGWNGSGALYRQHVMRAALLAALSHETNVTCETCWGRVNDIAPGARCKNPACRDGQVPGPRLILGEWEYQAGNGDDFYRDIFRDETPA